MTNGEAIKLLMSMKDGIIHVFDGDRMVALDMAISALQAQDSTSNLVSKNVVKNQMIKYGFTAPDMTVTEFVEDCLPSAHLDIPDTNVGDMISRQAAIRIAEQGQIHGFPWQFEQLTKLSSAQPEPSQVARDIATIIENEQDMRVMLSQPEWNNHTVACLLAELYDDTCACNYNGIDEWLPEKCEVIDACPNPAGVACWEQFLKHRVERREDGRK